MAAKKLQLLMTRLSKELEQPGVQPRIRRFVEHGLHASGALGHLVAFFMTKYTRIKYVVNPTPGASLILLRDVYETHLMAYTKALYNFSPVSETASAVLGSGLTAAELNGYLSLIIIGADAVFWEYFEDIQREFEETSARTKLHYMEAHNEKKRKFREKAKERLLNERTEAPKPGVAFTHAERKRMNAFVKEMREEEAILRRKHKKRSRRSKRSTEEPIHDLSKALFKPDGAS